MHQRSYCEKTAAAEIPSPNQNPFNPEISDFVFPDMMHGHQNQTKSTYLQHPSEASNTFGQRNAPMNQLDHHPNAYFQIEFSLMSRTHEMSSHFIPDFNENDNANRISQHNGTSLGTPILAVVWRFSEYTQTARFLKQIQLVQTIPTNVQKNIY
ncbi:hypothetical protein CDAR_514081 [Caerostris darwini]|uniref:Uncharacterized protein n=1 Tax=Caerostris darwini TaxID=1538125 RepID=A0AAV4QWR8_9ARAC|nr:hypothetical protein CDAR_514081 [Caerostris darwini]